MRTLTKVASATVLTAVTAVGGAGIAAAAGSAHAGSAIFMQSDRGMGRCSLTAVASKDGVDYGVTAGHCLQGNVSRITDVNGEVIANQDDIAAGKAMLDESNGGLNDFAYFRLVKGTEVSNLVYSSPTLGIQPVDQFLVDASSFFALPVGDPVPVTQDMVGQPVCKDGSSTGRTCGVVLNVNVETQEIEALIPAISGDSGAMLHVAGADGKRHPVGTLSSGSPLLFNLFDGTREHLAVEHLNVPAQ
ncbi:hypothetical protein [Corynebacterium falsenii]|uniref:hypothetical protein n=1 Tax=Corynebacterium falsenii TaxID=108486 RepID=UPI00046D0B8B|nr:hypothetical protein [Corynebacterium falsenii]UBI04512.1 S1 family peptidase [Corynebacterium falsenii]HJF11787.1 S1 family peptidase [Corynebacterium falsenii]